MARTGSERRVRVAGVVGEVVRQAVRDAGARGVVIPDDGSPEARLTLDWCRLALGADAVLAVPPPPPAAAATLSERAGVPPGSVPADRVLEETHRFAARVAAAARDALLAHPANKTALLLSGTLPPEPLLPLGDLYASQVEDLIGGWSAPPAVRALADEAGGIARLDAALEAVVDERRPVEALPALLGEAAGRAVLHALEAGRFARRRIGLVPKLGARTLGIDLFG